MGQQRRELALRRRTDMFPQEWQHQLRSSLHPALFASVYVVSDSLMRLLHVPPPQRAVLLTYLPKATQAVFAALGDIYTWRLAEKLFGEGSLASSAAVCRNAI
jgi:GPI mannosyltransferase 3